MDTDLIQAEINLLAHNPKLASGDELAIIFEETTAVSSGIATVLRPKSKKDGLGGLIELHGDIPCIIVPDLHARISLLPALLQSIPPGQKQTVAQLLLKKEIQVLMLGDGLHSEGQDAARRWHDSWHEYVSHWQTNASMTEEMTLAFNTMLQVSLMLREYPEHFFFLKGNHENILSEEGGGNHPFGKFADESRMSLSWTSMFLGQEFLKQYSLFEKTLPLLARGKDFLAVHAEPAYPIEPDDILEVYTNPALIEALTWTANGAAKPDAAAQTLHSFLPSEAMPGKIFCGHRVVSNGYALRCQGLLLQIHDKSRLQAAIVYPGQNFDPDIHIFELRSN